jgi:excisionase family DNA binding protein
MQQTETYYTVEQVAIMLSRGKDWVWAQCRDRKIPHHKLGRSYRFTDGDLKALAAQSAVPPGDELRVTDVQGRAPDTQQTPPDSIADVVHRGDHVLIDMGQQVSITIVGGGDARVPQSPRHGEHWAPGR